MPQLSKKSIQIVDKVIALLKIPDNQKLYNQDTFLDHLNDNKQICNTECCLAGWMDFIGNPKEFKADEKLFINLSEDDYIDEGDISTRIACRAEKLMTYEDGSMANTDNLFNLGDMWIYLGDEFIEAKTKSQKAKIAIKRLELFKLIGE